MKTLKSTAARGALAFVAAGSALALTACGAGQISQTANQVAAVNGAHAEEGSLAIRDAAVVVTPDNEFAVKFTAANVEEKGSTATLESLTVNGQEVTLNGDKAAKPGCNLVGDFAEAVEDHKSGANTLCNTYVKTELPDGSGLALGGEVDLDFTFDEAAVNMKAPVFAYTPKAGQYHRDEAGLTDKDGAEKSSAHH